MNSCVFLLSYLFMIGTLPTKLDISQTEESLNISLTGAEGRHYFIQSFSPQSNWTCTNDTSFTLSLINTTYDITISLCPEMNNSVKFSIGLL